MDRDFSKKRARSPRLKRTPPESKVSYSRKRQDEREHGNDSEYQWERERDRPDLQHDKVKPTPSAPPGFPVGYAWNKGDWLCPSPGCEGYVTGSRYQHCVNCGRSIPYFVVLTELAKLGNYRTEMCPLEDCCMRHCCWAHSASELRNLDRSREYIKSQGSGPSSGTNPPSTEDLRAFAYRWRIEEPGVSLLHRLPGQLADLVLRSFYMDPQIPDGESTHSLLKCLADLIRPRTFQVRNAAHLHELLPVLLKRTNASVSGLACSEEGIVAMTIDKEVALVACKEFSNEDLGLLAFAIAFNGMSVVHSEKDFDNLKNNFPKLFSNLIDRVRVVDNPSEIIYTASLLTEALSDRANQARLDALNPSPLLPTPSDDQSCAV